MASRPHNTAWPIGPFLALAVSVALGCYGPQFGDCTITCSEKTQCPTGLSCHAGYCSVRENSCGLDDGGSDSGGGDDAADAGDAETDPGDASTTDTDGSGDLGEADTDAPDGAVTDVPPDVPDDTPPDVPDDTPPDVAPDVPMDTVGDLPNTPDGPPDAPDGPPDARDGPPVAPDGPDGNDTPPPFTPGVIPNLVLWLESDRGIDAALGTKVPTWRDQSPLHNDAMQTTDAFAPTLAGPLAGKPALQFTFNTWLMIADTPTLSWGFDDFLVLVVYRSSGTCNLPRCIVQDLYRKQDVYEPWAGTGLGIQPGGRLEVYLSREPSGPGQWITTPATGYDSGRVHLMGGQRRSTWPSIRVDGVEYLGPPPTVLVNLNAAGENVYLGAHGVKQNIPDDFSFTGYISAIVAVKGPIPTADVARLETYLMMKYGVVAGGPP